LKKSRGKFLQAAMTEPSLSHVLLIRAHKIVAKLAEVLGLDRRELFFLANPNTEALLSNEADTAEARDSAWDQFRKNDQLRRVHNITNNEMEMLSRVALLGDVQSPRELIYILNTVRHALGK
jgi:hypothetical protein